MTCKVVGIFLLITSAATALPTATPELDSDLIISQISKTEEPNVPTISTGDASVVHIGPESMNKTSAEDPEEGSGKTTLNDDNDCDEKYQTKGSNCSDAEKEEIEDLPSTCYVRKIRTIVYIE
jgi:hypothetical protein